MGERPVPFALLLLLLLEYLGAECRLVVVVSTARPHSSATAAEGKGVVQEYAT
jgi:hypothetical protein